MTKPRYEHGPRNFLKHVRFDDGCWEWDGHTVGRGYGTMSAGHRSVRAHRFSWEYFNGPIPAGMNVLHSCDNPPCTRPEHLFLGTDTDNMQDAIRKGRLLGPRGERQGSSKLTASQVIEIRKLARDGITQRQIAAQFGIDPSNVSVIVSGKRWSHV